MTHCPQCGLPQDAQDSRFCRSCGTALAAPAPQRSRNTGLVVGIAVLAAGLAIAAGAVVLGRANHGNEAVAGTAPTAPVTNTATVTVAPPATATQPAAAPAATSAQPAPTRPKAVARTTEPEPDVERPPSGYPVGRWFLVLESNSQSQYSYNKTLAEAEDMPGGVSVINSSTVPGLRPGYWAIVSSDTYASSASAAADCGPRFHRPEGSERPCYPRRIKG